MPRNRSRPPGIIPTLYYEDVGTAVDWLCTAFGFRTRFHYGSPERMAGAQLVAGDGIVMVGEARHGQSPGWNDDATLAPPPDRRYGVIVVVHIDDIDAHCARAKQHGARIVHSPQTYPFGERQYTAEDLAGHRWGFSQSVADTAPEDWGGVRGPAFDE